MAIPHPPIRRHVWRALPFALAAVAGCAPVGPNAETPHVPWSPISWLLGHPAPPAAPHQPPPSVPVAAPADPNWWTLFGDPELTRLEGRVAAGNLDVQVAAVRLREARATLGVTFAGELPSLEGSAAYSRQKIAQAGVLSLTGSTGATTVPSPNTGGASTAPNSEIGLFQPFNLFQTGFDVTWEIDFWGHTRRQVESAAAAETAAGESQRDVLVSALAELARDYIRLRGVQRNLQITEDNEKIARQALQLTQERAAQGVTTDLDVAQEAALLASIAAQIPQQEAQRDDLIDAIALLLGQPPQALSDELTSAAPIPPVPSEVPVGVPSELARRRPDIRRAEAVLHEATADIGVAVADFYPRVTLTGSVALQATQLNKLGNWNDANTWALGPSLTIPIFEGARLHRTLELRKAEQQEAAISYRETVLTAMHEINTALTDFTAEQARRNQLRISVEQNRKALGLAQDRYTQGVSDFLDVLDAQRDLLTAELQFTDSTTTIATDLVQLYKALGGGWQSALPEGPTPTPPPITVRDLLE